MSVAEATEVDGSGREADRLRRGKCTHQLLMPKDLRDFFDLYADATGRSRNAAIVRELEAARYKLERQTGWRNKQ